ncbi:MAG: trigger factor [Bacteroidales bacterium]|nr:trigger factor [Bacteroidales bacterium]
MNISKESTGDLSATIKIEVADQDYGEQVEKSLRELQKKTSLKGFRPGKVPFGLVKKMYEKSAKAEEVNKLISDKLNNYIRDEKLDILGYPIANMEKTTSLDFENDTDFTFYFDIGLTPEIDLNLEEVTMDYYDIEVEEDKIDGYVEDTRKRYGNPVNPETAQKGDVIKGEIEQIDAEGNLLEDGVKNTTSLSIDFIKDENVQKEFIGSSAGDEIKFNPLKATGNEHEVTHMLAIKADEREKLESDYKFTISEITRMEPATLNEDFYKQVYPNDDVKTEAEFRNKLRGESNQYFQKESDNFFVHEVIEKLLHETEINLPDEFVKRWLAEADQEKSLEEIENNYDTYSKSLKQQVLISKLAKDNNIKVEREDIKDHIKKTFSRYYFGGMEDEDKTKQLDTIAESYMQNQEEVNKIYDQLYDEQIREVFKSKIKLNHISVSYDDFIKKVNEHHKHHHHEHE